LLNYTSDENKGNRISKEIFKILSEEKTIEGKKDQRDKGTRGHRDKDTEGQSASVL
jgi:hypothetical protein